MDKKNINGVSLAQYGLVVSLIALAIVPVFFTFGGQISNIFKSYLTGYEDMNNNIRLNESGLANALIKGVLTPGQLGGKADDPVRECFNNVCAIDYGNIVLNGIPSNYPDLVETSGTSGGTDKILSLMDNILKQMEANPNEFTTDEVAKIKGLIARGKDIVKIEKTFEEEYNKQKPIIEKATEQRDSLIDSLTKSYAQYKADNASVCKTDYECNQNFMKQSNVANQVNQLLTYNQQLTAISRSFKDTSLGQYTTADNKTVDLSVNNIIKLLDPSTLVNVSTNQDGSQSFVNSSSIAGTPTSGMGTNFFDIYLSKYYTLPSETDEKKMSLVGSYIQELKTLNEDPTYDAALKSITKTLSREVFDLSQNALHTSGRVNYYLYYNSGSFFDDKFISQLVKQGQYDTFFNSQMGTNLDKELGYVPSERSRLDLGLICNSHRGQYNKDNVTCKGQK